MESIPERGAADPSQTEEPISVWSRPTDPYAHIAKELEECMASCDYVELGHSFSPESVGRTQGFIGGDPDPRQMEERIFVRPYSSDMGAGYTRSPWSSAPPTLAGRTQDYIGGAPETQSGALMHTWLKRGAQTKSGGAQTESSGDGKKKR